MSYVHKFAYVSDKGRTYYELDLDTLPEDVRDKLILAAIQIADLCGGGHIDAVIDSPPEAAQAINDIMAAAQAAERLSIAVRHTPPLRVV